MTMMRLKHITAACLLAWLVLGLISCRHASQPSASSAVPAVASVPQRLVISIADQMMVTFDHHKPRRIYRVSTSRFGTGGKWGTYHTPLGQMEITEIVGQGLPVGAKLKARQPTGEIVPVNAPGRDTIVTRVLRLRGLEKDNARTLERSIYIHGTPNETKLKTPASYGCVRMSSADIITLCNWVKVGTRVDILAGKLPSPKQLPP
jgi:hypothetical protein